MTLTHYTSKAFSGDYQGRLNVNFAWTYGTLTYMNEFSMVSFNGGQNPAGGSDTGHPFLLTRRNHQVRAQQFRHYETSNGKDYYVGPVTAGSVPGFNLGTDPAPFSDSAMNTKGASFVRAAIPTNPAFSLARALGELKKDGLPDLVGLQTAKDRTRILKNSGDEYLNVAYGWAPIVSDLRKLAHTVKGANKHLRAHDRAMGSHHTRRRRSSPPVIIQDSYSGTNGILAPTIVNMNGNVTAVKSTTTREWFSGAFKYYVPIDDTLRGKMLHWESQANNLLGTRLTPQLVWQLAPWSWAVDWFTNTGDVMNNISRLGQDSLVMQYGYVMAHQQKRFHMHMTRPASSGAPAVDVSRSYLYETKQRRQANPYGFGVDSTSLSAYQLAIITALGLSKGGKLTNT